MSFSIRNLIKPILGIFLFGLALWFSPIEVNAYSSFGVTSFIPNGTTLPYNYLPAFSTELRTLDPSSYAYYVGYDNLPIELPFSAAVDGTYTFDFDFTLSFLNTFYNVSCNGSLFIEYYLVYEDTSGEHVLTIGSSFNEIHFDNDTPFPVLKDHFNVFCPGKPLRYTFILSTVYPGYGYQPWIFNVSPSYSGTAIPDSSSGTNTFTITGYSEPVNSHIQDIALIGNGGNAGDGYTGYVNLHSSAITLTGSVPFNSPDYDISFKQDDVDPSGSRFIFGFTSAVTNFHESFEKKIADQFEEYFDYQPPNTQSFNSDKSTVDSSINTVTNFQNNAFTGLNSAVNDTGLNSFDFAEYGPQMSYVGLLLTSIYNIFPNKFRYVIYFVLFIGFFGVLLNAGHYIKKMRDSE